jgi:hypothetical protein
MEKRKVIPELIDILNRKGTKEMAEIYLNCFNQELFDAVEYWAPRHGYKIGYVSGLSALGEYLGGKWVLFKLNK